MSSSSTRKAIAIIAVLFLLFSTGFGRKVMRSTTTGVDFATPSPFEESGGKAREMTELDYEDAGPNTNKRAGLVLPTPDPNPEAPAPQP